MLYLVHYVLFAAYTLIPLLVLGLGIRRSKQRHDTAPLVAFLMTFASATAAAVCLCLVYSRLMGGKIPAGQMFLAGYFMMAVLCVLKAFNWSLDRAMNRLLQLSHWRTGPQRLLRTRLALAGAMRAFVLVIVGLPYVVGIAMVYRPRITFSQDSRDRLGRSPTAIDFKALDGTSLDGLWLPTNLPTATSSKSDRAAWGTRTALLCPDLIAGRSQELELARQLLAGGYNVLIFDFRAYGNSAGRLTSFGDRERFDVLGAVRWLRANHADEAKKIYGVGASTGAAALIAAGADPGPEGQAIAAVAVYAGFDRLDRLISDSSRDYLPPPLRWTLIHIGLPLASVHCGSDLVHFAPAKLVQDFWPRPILFIHGVNDRVVDFDRGQSLFESYPGPKVPLWFSDGGHEDVLIDPGAATIVKRFFDVAEPIPVI